MRIFTGNDCTDFLSLRGASVEVTNSPLVKTRPYCSPACKHSNKGPITVSSPTAHTLSGNLLYLGTFSALLQVCLWMRCVASDPAQWPPRLLLFPVRAAQECLQAGQLRPKRSALGWSRPRSTGRSHPWHGSFSRPPYALLVTRSPALPPTHASLGWCGRVGGPGGRPSWLLGGLARLQNMQATNLFDNMRHARMAKITRPIIHRSGQCKPAWKTGRNIAPRVLATFRFSPRVRSRDSVYAPIRGRCSRRGLPSRASTGLSADG